MGISHYLTKSIKTKIILLLLVVVSGVMVAFEIYGYRVILAAEYAELDALSERTSTRLAENLEIPLWEVDSEWVESIITTEMMDKNIQGIFVEGEGGLFVSKTRDEQWQLVSGVSGFDAESLVHQALIFHDETKIGVVQLNITRRFVEAKVNEASLPRVVQTLFLVLTLILILSYIINRIVTNPLQRILETARLIAKGDYSRNIQIQSSDEIGMLGHEFNLMKGNVSLREKERDGALQQLQRELVHRSHNEAQLKLDDERTRAQLELTLKNFENEKALVAYALEVVTRISQSEECYLYLYDEMPQLIEHCRCFHVAHSAPLGEATSLPCTLESAGDWADALRYATPVIHNDGLDLQQGVALPSTISEHKYHLGVPIFSGGEMVAIVGVANSAKPYTLQLSETLSLYLNTMWDLLVKRRDAKELSELRHYLQNVIDSMPSVLVGVDANYAVEHWNHQAELVSGIEIDAAKGQGVEQVLPLFREQMFRLETALKEKIPQLVERVAHTQDGNLHYADIMVYPLVTNAHLGAVIRIDDVTERVRIEEMMVQTEKMMSVGGLAAGMAHEINNPLGGILQGVQNIRRRLSPELAKNQQAAEALNFDLDGMQSYLKQRQIIHFMDEISAAGKRASDIIANMLQFSRKAEGNRGEENINTLVEQTLDLAAVDYDLKKRYDFRKIKITREYEAVLPDVSCVGSEIQQVLLNLLRNAAQALLRQTERTQAAQITVRTYQRSEWLVIEVEDNGPGMSEEVSRRVFEPFFTTRPVGEGTGLGLSVSYFIIVEEHGGRLSVKAVEGQGSNFIIELPVV